MINKIFTEKVADDTTVVEKLDEAEAGLRLMNDEEAAPDVDGLNKVGSI